MTVRFWETPTHRGHDGSLATRGRARFDWCVITPRGRVHRVVGVVLRWNFLGGTRERPDVTFVLACGPQRHEVQPIADPCRREICVRCESAVRRTESRRVQD